MRARSDAEAPGWRMPGTEARGRKVVVVEDDADLLDLEGLLLGEAGYAVVGVTDGTQAPVVIRRERPDLVLLDFMLPGKDANQILVELADAPDTREIPVFVVSAFLEKLRPTPQVRRTFGKPLSFDELVSAANEELAAHGR